MVAVMLTGESFLQTPFNRNYDSANYVASATDRVLVLLNPNSNVSEQVFVQLPMSVITNAQERLDTTSTRTGAGAIDLTNDNTLIVSTGANAMTLAAGYEGQVKNLRMKTDGGDATVTITNLQGGTTATFNDVGDFLALKYLDGKWNILQNNGVTIA